MITESILTCPACSFQKKEVMQENLFPTNVRCSSCKKKSTIAQGSCCIYCEFGDYPCLQAQIEGFSCCSGE